MNSVSPSVPTIVVDSNTIVNGPWNLASWPWQILLIRSKRGEVRLVVPKVVLIETVARFKSSLAEAMNKYNELGKKIADLAGLPLPSPEHQVPELVADYETSLRETLAANSVVIGEIPPMALEDLVHRAASRKKPFDSDGNGFRDALIWLSFLAEIERANTTEGILITSDSAYWHGDVLHQDLLDDITSRGQTVEVIPYKSLKACVYERFFNKLSLEQQQDLESKFSNSRAEIESTVRRVIETILQDYQETVTTRRKVSFNRLSDLKIIGVPRREPDTDQVLVHMTCVVTVIVSTPRDGEVISWESKKEETIEAEVFSWYNTSLQSFEEITVDGVEDALSRLITPPPSFLFNQSVLAAIQEASIPKWMPSKEYLDVHNILSTSAIALALQQVATTIPPSFLQGFLSHGSEDVPPEDNGEGEHA